MVRVRMDEALWKALEDAAHADGKTASEVLRRYAELYVRRSRIRNG